jgi:tRNA-(ms[2]io[6]A)-hydroxylase
MKAASNALSLAGRWPSLPRLVKTLAELAEEELRHFRAVLGELDKRGIALGKPEVDTYAAELRKAAAKTGARTPAAALIDRLLVGALIEARSCERFRLLEGALREQGEHALAAFYEDLFAAEARHYMTFVELAADVAGGEDEARGRLVELAKAEGELCAKLGMAPTMHG